MTGRILIVSLIVTVLCRSAEGQNTERFQLIDDDVVVFVGGTNMVHLQRAAYLETILTRTFASCRPKFRDLSWEADTVFRQGTVIERWRKDGWRREGFGDLATQLSMIDATVVIAQFGQLEAMGGPDLLDDFTAAYGALLDIFQSQVRLVVVITPPPFETPESPHLPNLAVRNGDLSLYVEATKRIAAARKLVCVDLFSDSFGRLTDNGIHVTEDAQEKLAEQIADQLGVPALDPVELLREAVSDKHRLWSEYWRPANWKLLYGDDAERQFTRGGENSLPFKEEWKKLLPLVANAEARVWTIASGGKDPGSRWQESEVLHGDTHADIERELVDFSPADGLQVNLFASEAHGLTSPLNLRWDADGGMYVTVTTTYPHVRPGDLPNDKIILLKDRDADGYADGSTVFAEGLNIPTGIELGNGGVYVGQNTDMLFLKDTDGDGRADQRHVLLGGFGNGDSHQTINSFIWSPDGELVFGHGDGCESRVETPWGTSSLFNAGYFRLRPLQQRLVPFLEGHMAAGNPWGVAFDQWGQMFGVDGAGGVSWLSPGLVSTTHREQLRRIGQPGGYCGIGYLDGRHLPQSMRGHFAVGDFKQNCVSRFSIHNNGADFELVWKEPLLRSKHRNFRPVDVKTGPDGAVYIVDWYNPVICHQDDAYRDPSRDKAHGRIWRLSAKAATVKPQRLSSASLTDVIDSLKSPEHWTRYQAKRALAERDSAAVADSLRNWIHALDAKDPRYEHHLYEALGAFATIEVVEPGLLGRMLEASHPMARAFATRLVGRWHDRLDQPLELLSARIADDHPVVRMEAVVACSAIWSPESVRVATAVVNKPIQEWIRYAFRQTVRHLKPVWLPALRQGQLNFEHPSHLAAALNEAGGHDVLTGLRTILESAEIDNAARTSAVSAILAAGGSDDLAEYGFNRRYFTHNAVYRPTLHAHALMQMIDNARTRDVRPSGDIAPELRELIGEEDLRVKMAALRLAGAWQILELDAEILEVARNKLLPAAVRCAAFEALAEVQSEKGITLLESLSQESDSSAIRASAIQAFIGLDTDRAAELAAELLASDAAATVDMAPLISGFLTRTDGTEVLAKSLTTRNLKSDTAQRLLRSLFASGRSDQVLFDVLSRTVGSAHQIPNYSGDYVAKLVSDSHRHGDVARGATVFSNMACTSCHKVSGTGGSTGPDLTSIGTTLSAERIVEELLWPDRQVKEGYTVVIVLTVQGRVHTGVDRTTVANRKAGEITLENLATRNLTTISKDHIEAVRDAGSPMPAGLTALLSRPQLIDLILYLSQLGAFQ